MRPPSITQSLLKPFISSSTPINRIHALQSLRARIFNTNFNPTHAKLGNSILRARLKGRLLAQYYPPRINAIKELKKEFVGWHFTDENEERRLQKIERKKMRGKGAPKKVKTKEEGKKFKKRKR